MISQFVALLVCRLTGKQCTEERPASKDLRSEMQSRSRSVEAEAITIRRERNFIEADFQRRQGRKRHEHA